jgi:hypothetical protein
MAGPTWPSLPTGLLSMTVSEPTVIAVGPGSFYGYAEIDDQVTSLPMMRLRIGDADSVAAQGVTYKSLNRRGPGIRISTSIYEIKDLVNSDYGRAPPMRAAYLYFMAWSRNPMFQHLCVPPYGQRIMPFVKGLSVLSLPEGMSVTMWYLPGALPLGAPKVKLVAVRQSVLATSIEDSVEKIVIEEPKIEPKPKFGSRRGERYSFNKFRKVLNGEQHA